MTPSKLKEWVAAQPKQCEYCGTDCAEDYQVDHIVPIAKGGEHQTHNLAIACPSCNLSKGGKDPDQFLDELYGG